MTMQEPLENLPSAPSGGQQNLPSAPVISSETCRSATADVGGSEGQRQNCGRVEGECAERRGGEVGDGGGGRDQEMSTPSANMENKMNMEKVDTSSPHQTITIETKPAHSPPAHWHLYWAAGAANIAFIGVGCIFAWTSSAEKFYVKLGGQNGNPGPIPPTVWSWVAGLTPLGAALGPIPFGFLTDKFGRKPCLLSMGTLALLSWLLIAFFDEQNMLLVARFLAGVAVGACFTVLPMYIAEISTDSVRSTLGSMVQFSMVLGFILSYGVGPYVRPLTLALVSGAVPVAFLALFSFMPESPYVLIGRGDTERARDTLAWLRGQTPTDVTKEIYDIQAATDEASAKRIAFIRRFCMIVSNKGNVKAFTISCGLLMFQQASGINPVSFFTQGIFEATGSGLDPAVSTIIIGVVQFFASTGTIILTGWLSMKSLLVISAIGMAAGHAGLGYYFYVSKNGGDVSALGVLPIAALVLYIVMYCFGFGPLPWAVMGEMFGNDVKATAASLCATYCWGLGFILTWQFTPLVTSLGEAWTFWTFGICCVVAAAFTLLLVPNTKGKSLQEIQDYLNGRDS